MSERPLHIDGANKILKTNAMVVPRDAAEHGKQMFWNFMREVKQ